MVITTILYMLITSVKNINHHTHQTMSWFYHALQQCLGHDIDEFVYLSIFSLQVDLSVTEQELIMGELSHLPDICDCLATLDIAIGFLLSVGGDSNTSLKQFLSEKLRLNVASTSATSPEHNKKTPVSAAHLGSSRERHDEGEDVMTRIAGRCRLQHARSLWLTLARHKASMLHRHGQTPMDSVPDKYKVPLHQDQVSEIHD